MKFFVATLLTAALAFIAGLKFPWWGIAIAAFLVAALVHQKPGKAFLSGFLALFILWGILAFRIDMANQSILSKRIAELLPLQGNSYLLILVTALVGGLVAGLAALSGSFLRQSK